MNYRNPRCFQYGSFNNYMAASSDLKVKPGLSVSPAQMMEYTARGIAISASNLSYMDGDTSRSMDIPLEARRGIDAADVWQASETAKKRLVNVHVKDVKEYGL